MEAYAKGATRTDNEHLVADAPGRNPPVCGALVRLINELIIDL